MVKNTKGGKGHKSLGRKYQSQTNNVLRLSTDPLEIYAFVTKIFGGGMCEVYYVDDKEKGIRLIGHIRKKMKGRQKRFNNILPNSYVLVGLREWESTPKNCDIVCVYDEHQVDILKQNPSINISSLNQFNTRSEPSSSINIEDNDCFSFRVENENEDIDINEINDTFITNDDGEEIDIDDI